MPIVLWLPNVPLTNKGRGHLITSTVPACSALMAASASATGILAHPG